MSLEAWGDESPDYGISEERVEEAFRDGARACREMLARFVEHGGNPELAQSIRLNWVPSWGDDPGLLAGAIPADAWNTCHAAPTNNANVSRAVMASVKLGAWMSAALDDPNVCEAMKADIREWFSAGEPVSACAAAIANFGVEP